MASLPDGFRDPKPKLRKTSEKKIEHERGKAFDEHYKFTSPGRRGVPDRIALNRIPAEHQELVSRYFRFVEYKSPIGVLSSEQIREIRILRELGFTVDVINSLD